MLLAVPVAASVQVVVLALIPKLSQEVDVAPERRDSDKDARAMEQETKNEHTDRDVTEEIHRYVAEAVEAIEQEDLEQRR